MRYMILVKGRPGAARMPPPALMEAINTLGVEAAAAGVRIEPGGLKPAAEATRFRIDGGKLSVTDGPYAEAKEVVGGYAICEAPSREAALASTRHFMELHLRHWPEWEGECEVREILDKPKPPWL